MRFAPAPVKFAPGIHPSASIDPTVKLGERVSIQPHAVIEAATQIGDDAVIGGSRGAAVRLGLNRTTLINRMKKLGISRPKPDEVLLSGGEPDVPEPA